MAQLLSCYGRGRQEDRCLSAPVCTARRRDDCQHELDGKEGRPWHMAGGVVLVQQGASNVPTVLVMRKAVILRQVASR